MRKGRLKENHTAVAFDTRQRYLSLLWRKIQCRIRGSDIAKRTSGVDLLAFFYKLIVSVYTVKEFFLKNMILLLACKFLEGTGRVL